VKDRKRMKDLLLTMVIMMSWILVGYYFGLSVWVTLLLTAPWSLPYIIHYAKKDYKEMFETDDKVKKERQND